MKHYLLLFVFFCTLGTFAQSLGSIEGKLVDKEFNNEPLAFANVEIKGTGTIAYSDMDGLYTIDNLKPGKYELVYSFVGYKTNAMIVEVIPGETTNIDVTMYANTRSSNKVVFTKTAELETNTELN